ncbi:hypothetical protein [Patulibacter sp.]|uniref:hypothetical protein n=1 Tax=Patulibacter sp. TaxID=1912859 RepID=UPI00271EA0EC|nr:hypothetical protein [Patulibacter sp.]MDO9408195.1 hypothetical protein [Patulibacter sp.]
MHLVRKGNGVAPFERFMASYNAHPAGAEHDLVLLFKGYEGGENELLAHLDRAPEMTKHLVVGDNGFDLTAYRQAADRLPHERACFLNSFSRVLHPGWLGLLADAFDDPSVGLAGATGSWESTVSLGLRQLGDSLSYPGAFATRAALLDELRHESGDSAPNPILEWLFVAKETVRSAREFRRFPSAHLRTNAFLIERERFLGVPMPALSTKRDALVFENGRRGLTATVRAQGLRSVVVDRTGVARGEADWAEGNVFWQDDQQDLLVADNQTDAYDAAGARVRALRSRKAWGASARGVATPSFP